LLYTGNKWAAYQRELLCLDVTAQIEIPDYNGNRLDSKTQENLTKVIMLIKEMAGKLCLRISQI
jgi:hypothetical protein